MSPAPRPITDVLLRSQSDERLWALAGAGHPRAFTVLLQRHLGLLTVIARSVAGPAEAEDVIQEGAARAWRALQAGAEVTNPRAWLVAIVRHAATESASRAVPGAGDPASEVIDPRWVEGSVHDRVEVRDLLRAIGELPDNQRRVLVAAEFDGASRTEIAAALQVSEGAVRQLTHRARLTLRAAMTAIIPFPLLSRALAGGSASLSSSVSLEAVSSFAGGTAVLKGGAVLLAIGALGGGAALHAVLGGPSGHREAAVHGSRGRFGHVGARVVATASARAGAIPNLSDRTAGLRRRGGDATGLSGRLGAGAGSGRSRRGRPSRLGAGTTVPLRHGDGTTTGETDGAGDGSGTDQGTVAAAAPGDAGAGNGGGSSGADTSQSVGQDAGGQSTSASDSAQTPTAAASSGSSQDGAGTTTPTTSSGSDTTPTATSSGSDTTPTDTSTGSDATPTDTSTGSDATPTDTSTGSDATSSADSSLTGAGGS